MKLIAAAVLLSGLQLSYITGNFTDEFGGWTNICTIRMICYTTQYTIPLILAGVAWEVWKVKTPLLKSGQEGQTGSGQTASR